MPSKNIKRDEKGCPILQGSNTFGSITRPKGGKRQPRNHDLKVQASERLASLMTYGGERREPPIRQTAAMRSHNEFAVLSPFAKLTYYMGRFSDLNEELDALRACGNKRKIDFIEPAIQMQIEQTRSDMGEMYKVCVDEYGRDKLEEMLGYE